MQDEVYNYGSFLQSKMFHEGVTCSDCHEPHTQKLRQPKEEVCGSCHYLKKYSSTEHHHHKVGTPEASCIACHLSARTYMVVDTRHDHSFRIPRPDESAKFGTPNACNDCHKDKSASWAAKAADTWYGGAHKGFQQYTQTLAEARLQSAAAATDLLNLAENPDAPNIARATALTELSPYLDADAYKAARGALESPDPLLRISAVELIAAADPGTRWPLLSPLLSDPVLAVRSAAASALADALPANLSAEEKTLFQSALADFVSTQELNADRPEGRLSLGNLYARQSQPEQAESEYESAIKLWPAFIPAYVNLADLYRARGEDGQAEHWLLAAQKNAPQNADVIHSLALLRVRQHRTDEAVQLLQRAAQLAPNNAHYAYVYAVGLYSSGKAAAGLEALRKANDRFPANREILLGLASLSAESGDLQAAEHYAEQFERLAPSDGRGSQVLKQLSESRVPR
jgi:Flp pilus assembly protein TadD